MPLMIFYDVKDVKKKKVKTETNPQSVNGIIYNPRTIQLNQI